MAAEAQGLAAALAAVPPQPLESPDAGRQAVQAASQAAAELLALATDPSQNKAALSAAVREATDWAAAVLAQLPAWEAALGPQHDWPEKAAHTAGFDVGQLLRTGERLPPDPGAPREAGAAASPARAAARLHAAAVLVLLDAALGCLAELLGWTGALREAVGSTVPAQLQPLEEHAALLIKGLEDTGLPYGVSTHSKRQWQVLHHVDRHAAVECPASTGLCARWPCHLPTPLLCAGALRGGRRRPGPPGNLCWDQDA